MSFVFFTSLEIFMAIALLLEIKNKDKLIEFESKVIRCVKRRIRSHLSSEKICRVCEAKTTSGLRKSA